MAPQFLKAYPDIGLQVLDQMAQMNVAIGVRQRGSDQDAAGHQQCVW
jgi:hypothetical protein